LKNKLSLSLLIIFFIGFLNAVNIALDNFLFDIFAMKTKKFFMDIELWRMFTYSFFTNSIEGFALFIFTFYFLLNKVEIFLGNKTYSILLTLVTFLIGSITTLSMINENVVFSGLEGTSFFIISIFLWLTKNRFIKKNSLYLHLSIILSMVLWFGVKSYIAIEYGFIHIVPSLIMALCGIIIGSLVFLQIKYLIEKRINPAKIKITNTKPNADFVGYSIYTNPKFKKYLHNKIEQNYWLIKEKTANKEENIETNAITDEERLDQILDKINSVGQSNLTKQEMEFLNYYSNKLQN
jgi:membrane associated rhomboid family serine protease